MNTEAAIHGAALNFLSGNTTQICRLCFGSTEKEEIYLDSLVSHSKWFCEETVSFYDMFENLQVKLEESLPQSLCKDCAANVIKSYLFQQLCQSSHDKWHEILCKFDDNISQADAVNPNTQSVYIVINNKNSIVYATKKRHQFKTKDVVLKKVKSIIYNRCNYVKSKSKKLKLGCDECGMKFESNLVLAKHSRSHQNLNYPCKQCARSFPTGLQLKEHEERVHYDKTIQCSQCVKMFSTDKMVKQHFKHYHEPVACKLCFVKFPSRNALRLHLDKHDLHKCPRCKKNYSNKWTFKFHLKICEHKGERRASFICDICQKGYARKNGLRTHLKTDHGFGNVLTCKWCDKKFDAMSRLKYHIVKHTKERKFYCNICGGKFVTPAALKYHTRLHTGEKPFPCDLCDERFLSASRRMEHKNRIHFEPKQQCHICNSLFYTGTQLRKHISRHYNPQSKLFMPNLEPQSVLESGEYSLEIVGL